MTGQAVHLELYIAQTGACWNRNVGASELLLEVDMVLLLEVDMAPRASPAPPFLLHAYQRRWARHLARPTATPRVVVLQSLAPSRCPGGYPDGHVVVAVVPTTVDDLLPNTLDSAPANL